MCIHTAQVTLKKKTKKFLFVLFSYVRQAKNASLPLLPNSPSNFPGKYKERKQMLRLLQKGNKNKAIEGLLIEI